VLGGYEGLSGVYLASETAMVKLKSGPVYAPGQGQRWRQCGIAAGRDSEGATRRRGRRGRAVQVDPIKPTLTAPGTMRLKLKCGQLLSCFYFSFNLRRYSEGAPEAGYDVDPGSSIIDISSEQDIINALGEAGEEEEQEGEEEEFDERLMEFDGGLVGGGGDGDGGGGVWTSADHAATEAAGPDRQSSQFSRVPQIAVANS